MSRPNPINPQQRATPKRSDDNLILVAIVFAIAGGQLAGWAATEYGLFGGPSGSFWYSAPGMLLWGVWDLHKEPMLQRGWYSELTGGWNVVLAIHATVAMTVTSFVIAWVVNRSLLLSVGIATLLTGAVGAALVWYYGNAFPMPANPYAVKAGPVVLPALGGSLAGAFGLIGVIAGTGNAGEDDGLVRGTRVDKEVERPKRLGTGRAGRGRGRNRGTSRTTAKALATGRVAFADRIMERDAETRHIAFMGVTGTGKSQSYSSLIQTAIERGDRMIVADPGGEALSRFWRPGDTILNPFDARSVKWDLFAEIEDDTDYDRLAEALLPLSGASEGDRWTKRGRVLLSSLMRSYHEVGTGGSDDFARVLRSGSNELWAELCAGTEAAPLFEEGNERLRGSVKDELAPAVKLLGRMAALEGAPFSIREWVRGGERNGEQGGKGGNKGHDGGRLWLPYRINQLATLRSAIGCWLGMATIEALSQTPDPSRRLWFMADELDVLGPVPDLDTGLTNGRKYGACYVLGLQSIAQLRKTYGAHTADTIIENCSTKLLLRCEMGGDGGTAEFASNLIGDREIAYEDVTMSPGGAVHTGQDGRTQSIRYQVERAVLASEIANLPDLTGYLRLAGADRWRKVAFEATGYEAIERPFVPVRTAARNRPMLEPEE